MGEVIYKQFRGDELLVINPTTYDMKNVYESKYNQRVYGNLIVAKEAGVLLSEDGIKTNVDVDDVIFVNYDFCFVIKSDELCKLIYQQIEKRLKREEERALHSSECCTETPSK